MSQKKRNTGVKLNTWIRSLFTVLFTFYALFMISGLIPNESFLKQKLSGLLGKNKIATASTQQWKMFHSIPYFRDYDVVIEAVDRQGGIHELGPILPGWDQYTGDLRNQYFFTRLGDPRFSEFLDRYKEILALELSKSESTEFVEFSIRLNSYYIPGLADLRSGEAYPSVNTTRIGPIRIN